MKLIKNFDLFLAIWLKVNWAKWLDSRWNQVEMVGRCGCVFAKIRPFDRKQFSNLFSRTLNHKKTQILPKYIFMQKFSCISIPVKLYFHFEFTGILFLTKNIFRSHEHINQKNCSDTGHSVGPRLKLRLWVLKIFNLKIYR